MGGRTGLSRAAVAGTEDLLVCHICVLKEMLNQLPPVIVEATEKHGLSEMQGIALLAGFLGDLVHERIKVSPPEALFISRAFIQGKEFSQKLRATVRDIIREGEEQKQQEEPVKTAPESAPKPKPRKRRMYRGYGRKRRKGSVA
jgi:hypothetical protein